MVAAAKNESNLTRLYEILADKWQRLNSLYWIVDKAGNIVKFQCNAAQQNLFEEMWYMNLILKDRQRGYTTFIDLYILDECLFNDNVEGGIIAHRQEDARKIFRRKIRFPYDHLPGQIKAARPLMTDSKTELEFPNGSLVYVDTSMRSGTVQLLHLSEFGYVCAKFPQKAQEIITGSLEAIHPGQIVFVESTAEGREGYFYDYCQEAMKTKASNRRLSKLDFKFFFTGWTDDPDKVLDTPVPITKADETYFTKTEFQLNKRLTQEQKWWWAAKKRLLKEAMSKENPATPEEAFEAAIEGAYYATNFMWLRENGHICSVPHQVGYRVDTWWDLGWSDATAIWFTQTVGKEIRVIGYYENSNEGLLHYAKYLDVIARVNNWVYGRHTAPHDIGVHELGSGKSRLELAQKLVDPSTGRKYPINFMAAKRIEDEMDGIEAVRSFLPKCWFDETATTISHKKRDVGLPSLENYRKQWDEAKGTFLNRPLHNWASHGAKSFETLALAHDMAGIFSNLNMLKR